MTLRFPIYLDHNATTPVDPRAFEAMRPYFMEVFGNAASKSHRFGWDAEAAVIKARNQVAALLSVAGADDPRGAQEIVFTSGATEANNVAIKGVAEQYRDKGRHLVTQVTEHVSVVETCKRLQRDAGFEVTWLAVDRKGRVGPEQVADAVRPDTVLVSVMWANNETGTIQPMRQIGAVCRERGVLLHSDATQAVGKVPIDVEADFVDLLSLSGHKFYGPKGCGALYARRKNGTRVRLSPLFDGGGHERGFRAGTLNVPGIVGLGEACEIARNDMAGESARLAGLRDRLQQGIMGRVEGVVVNGDGDAPAGRLPHVTNLSFTGVDDGQRVMRAMSDVALSSGSACSSGGLHASYVLLAMGVPEGLAHSAVRFGVGRFTTEEEVDYVVEKIAGVVARLREPAAKAGECGVPVKG